MVNTRFTVTYYDAPEAGRLALMTLDNGADYRKPNVLGVNALDSLERALGELERQPEIKGLLVTGKPYSFAAGADLRVFESVDEAFARQAARRGHELFSRLRDLPYPTLAAINGVCLGGGLELALHCDYRVLSAAAGALGFPEVFLSIVPAWGGTQLAPRLVGAQGALQVVVHHALDNNRLLRPQQALDLGFADRLLPPVTFGDDALVLLQRIITGQERIERAVPSVDGLDEALAAARQAVDARVHGATPAPYRAIDLIGFAARGGDLAEGLAREEDALAQLLSARQAQAAVYSFHLTQQRVKRQPWRPAVDARPVRKVGIVGAGLMGTQLGALLLRRLEVPLVLKDVDQDVLDRARAHVDSELDKRVQRGRLAEPKARFLKSLVTTTLDDADLASSDLVIEAVLEDLDLKRRVLADVERVVDPGAVLATNTSSLSVSAMAAGLVHPERVVGLHFFNPVAVMPLVEIVRTEQASDQALATAFEVVQAAGKSAVPCADAPAFVVNRILTRFMLSCAATTRRGADFGEVDDAVKALGLPMGPFELLGLVGPRVAAHVARTLHEAFGERFPLDENLQALGASGLPGIYDWSKGRAPYDEVRARWQVDADARAPSPGEIRQDALEAVADEARRLLDDGVVADARDIDTCLLLGAGWPFFLGGICKYLDQVGISEKLFGAPLVDATDRAEVH